MNYLSKSVLLFVAATVCAAMTSFGPVAFGQESMLNLPRNVGGPEDLLKQDKYQRNCIVIYIANDRMERESNGHGNYGFILTTLEQLIVESTESGNAERVEKLRRMLAALKQDDAAFSQV